MKKFSIDLEKAKQIYPDAPKSLQADLEKTFGKTVFIPENIMGKIKTFSDACKACKTTEAAFNAKVKKQGLLPDEVAYQQIKIIARALNEGWKPDWNNSDEYKYYPWFEFSGSGFGYSHSGCGYDYTATAVGSRLCYKNLDLAKHAGKTFIKIYNSYLI